MPGIDLGDADGFEEPDLASTARMKGVEVPPRELPDTARLEGVRLPAPAAAGPDEECRLPSTARMPAVELPSEPPRPRAPLQPSVKVKAVELSARPEPTVVGVQAFGVEDDGPTGLPQPGPLASPRPTGPVADPPASARGVAWDAWENAGPMPRRVRVSGEVWDLVDQIDVRNPASEEAHGFEVHDASRLLREQGTFRYRSGGPVDGRGYRHVDGATRFVIRNVVPYEPLALVRQVLATADERVSLLVAGRKVASSETAGCDDRAPWRNRTFVVPPNRVATPEVRLEVTDDGSPAGVTCFNVWCYQRA